MFTYFHKCVLFLSINYIIMFIFSSFASAFIAGMLQGFNLDLCIKQGFCAAFLSLQSTSAVPETLSTKTVMTEDAFQIFSNWKPVDVTNGYSD